jgi:uroporphyrinogen III methyltransferase/synthase
MSLHGKTVLVTRRREQSDELVSELEKLGASTVVAPMIDIAEPVSWRSCDAAVERLGEYDGLIFTSVNAVEMFLRRVEERGGDTHRLHTIPVFAVGEKTQQALAARGIRAERPAEETTGEELGRAMAAARVEGKVFLHPRGNLGRGEVEQQVAAAGGRVEAVVVYTTRDPDGASGGAVKERILSGEIDVVTFASPSAVRGFLAIVSAETFDSLSPRPRVVVIGPTTAEAARAAGLAVDAVASDSTSAALARAVNNLYH